MDDGRPDRFVTPTDRPLPTLPDGGPSADWELRDEALDRRGKGGLLCCCAPSQSASCGGVDCD